MKVLHIYPYYHKSGGVERYLWELTHNQMISKDYNVDVLCSNIPMDSPKKINFVLPKYFNGFLTRYLFPYVATWLLLDKKKRDQYSVIHSQGASCFIQDLVTAHSCHKAWFRFSLSQLSIFSGRFWLKILNPIHHATILIETMQYRGSATRRIVAVSNITKREIIANFSYPSEKISVIYPAVNIEEFKTVDRAEKSRLRQIMNLDDEEIVICFAGNEFARKGLATLISALEHFKSRPGWRLCVCGKDNPDYYQKLANICGISSRIRFLGKVENLSQWLSASDIFALPTSTDAFGLVALEAMASGLPVITTRAAGVSEIMTDGVDAMLITNSTSIQALQGKLGALMDSPELRKSIGNSARKTAEEMTWKSMAQKFDEVYVQIMREKSLR